MKTQDPVFSITRNDLDWSYTRGTGAGGQKKTRPARLFIVLIVQVVLMAIQKQAVANLKIVKKHFVKWLSRTGSSVGLSWNTNAELVNS
jgi:hypothetical protein